MTCRIVLSTKPGFSDLPATALAGGNTALGVHLARINSNAAFGLVRMECFIANYHDGETVPLPTSSIDGYKYDRSELTYIWGIQNSVQPETGWITGPDSLWFGAWVVDQATGTITCREWYRRSGQNDDAAISHDGTLAVFTIAQRQRNTLIVSSPLNSYNDVSSGSLGSGGSYGNVAAQLNTNAKFGALNMECFYMGEFVDGQTVGTPVSPADGYAYSRAQTTLVFCWRWTALASGFAAPDLSLGQLGPILASVNQSTGAVSVTVNWYDEGNQTLTPHHDYGRIAVFAFAHRHNLINTLGGTANQFAEIPPETFFPGSTLQSATMQQLNNNIRESAASPEIFGPTIYSHGQIVPQVVSPKDGYQYAYNEMFIMWEWADTTMDIPTHLRMAAFLLHTEHLPSIDLEVWRLPPGGPYTIGNLSFPKVAVTVLAVRENCHPVALPPAPFGNPTVPPLPPVPGGGPPPGGSGGGGGAQPVPIIIASMLNCLVSSLQIVHRFDFPRAMTFAVDMVPSQAWVDVPPSTQQIFSIQKFVPTNPNVGTQFGTVTFNPGSIVGKFASTTATSFAVGDCLKIVGPTVPGDGAGMAFSLVGIANPTTGTLQSMIVTPPTATVANGATTSLSAIGTYSDGSVLDLSASATWTSSNPAIATVGVSNGGPAPLIEDLLDWLLIAYPARTTSHMTGTQPHYHWLDADGQKFWLIKNQLGNPWDINTYDGSFIYHWITENASAWLNPSAYKRHVAPQPIGPRMFDLAGGPITVTASGSNPIVQTLACESDGQPIINLGSATNIWTNAGTLNWGGSVGSQVTIRDDHYFGSQREQFFYCKGFGLVQWTHANLTSGSPGPGGTYLIDQTTTTNNLVSGGCPTPNFPCYTAIPGPGFTGSWIGGAPGAGGNVGTPTAGGGIATGLVTGVSPGTATITAAIGSISASATVTVT